MTTSTDGPVYACCQGSLHVGHTFDCEHFVRYETRQLETLESSGVQLFWTWDIKTGKWVEPRVLVGGISSRAEVEKMTAEYNKAYAEIRKGNSE
jgi:hypothetical protein